MALDKVKPEKIYLFAIHPGADEPKAFLERLTGLVKFAINKRGGRVMLAELAAATAQREVTVRLGLEWLAAGGYLVIELNDQELHLAKRDWATNPYVQQELLMALKMSLIETAAYRAYFAEAKKPEDWLTVFTAEHK